jgi:hypothetical protein
MVKPTDRTPPCGKCGSAATHVTARSVSPPIAYVGCTACGHTSVVFSDHAAKTPATR